MNGALYRWLRLDTTDEPFPREVGKYRDVVSNLDNFLKWFEENKNSEFCWASLYSYDQISRRRFDTIFLDFDLMKYVATYGEWETILKLFQEMLEGLLGMFPRVRLYYSGKKGFHLYLDFGEEIEIVNFGETVREFVNRYVAQYVDMQVVGDVRRMVRIVGNVRNTGRMIELNPYLPYNFWLHAIEELKDMDDLNDFIYADTGVSIIKDIDKWITEKKEEKLNNSKLSSFKEIEKIPPCIGTCVYSLAETGELDHLGRILLASWMIKAGFSDDEIVDVFSVAKDFRETYTRYQVGYLRRKNYKLYACKNIIAAGLCPYKCKLYPWIEADKDGNGIE